MIVLSLMNVIKWLENKFLTTLSFLVFTGEMASNLSIDCYGNSRHCDNKKENESTTKRIKK